MGGVRTAGDLVAWMQLTKQMKIDQAKAYVAERLNVAVRDLTDETIMAKKRESLGLSSVIPDHVEYTGIAAKTQISRLLDIPIRSVELFHRNLNR